MNLLNTDFKSILYNVGKLKVLYYVSEKARNIHEEIKIADNKGGLILGLKSDGADKDWTEYIGLKIHDVASVNPEDLPDSFSIKAFHVIDEFRRKTVFSDEEWFLYFDYITGEIIYCFKGEPGHIEAKIDVSNLIGKNVASVHNHPIGYFSPPSSGNFQMLEFDFEDYEIVCGELEYWILEAKGCFNDLIDDINEKADKYYRSSLDIFLGNNESFKSFIKSNNLYGTLLSNYINTTYDNIQLIKGDYYEIK